MFGSQKDNRLLSWLYNLSEKIEEEGIFIHGSALKVLSLQHKSVVNQCCGFHTCSAAVAIPAVMRFTYLQTQPGFRFPYLQCCGFLTCSAAISLLAVLRFPYLQIRAELVIHIQSYKCGIV